MDSLNIFDLGQDARFGTHLYGTNDPSAILLGRLLARARMQRGKIVVVDLRDVRIIDMGYFSRVVDGMNEETRLRRGPHLYNSPIVFIGDETQIINLGHALGEPLKITLRMTGSGLELVGKIAHNPIHSELFKFIKTHGEVTTADMLPVFKQLRIGATASNIANRMASYRQWGILVRRRIVLNRSAAHQYQVLESTPQYKELQQYYMFGEKDA